MLSRRLLAEAGNRGQIFHQQVGTGLDVIVIYVFSVPLRIGIHFDGTPEDSEFAHALNSGDKKVSPNLKVGIDQELRQFGRYLLAVLVYLFQGGYCFRGERIARHL